MELKTVLASIPKHEWSSEPEVGVFIAALIKLTGAKKVIEAGTFQGLTSCCILDALPHDGYLISIDINDYRPEMVKEYFNYMGCFFKQESSFTVLESLTSNIIDIAFLDSAHEYEQVSGEFKRCERLIKSGGIILMHDYYSCDGVKSWVDELKLNHDYEITIFNTPGGAGLAMAIKK